MNRMTWRARFCCGVGILALAACTKPKIVLEPTKLEPQRVVVMRDGRESLRTVLRSGDEKWHSDVVNIQWQGGRVVQYELEGWYASAGLSPARLRFEQTLEHAVGSWTVIHQPVVSRFGGKENNNVTGYNYNVSQRRSLPKNIDYFSIILKDTEGNVVVKKTCQVAEQACI